MLHTQLYSWVRILQDHILLFCFSILYHESSGEMVRQLQISLLAIVFTGRTEMFYDTGMIVCIRLEYNDLECGTHNACISTDISIR